MPCKRNDEVLATQQVIPLKTAAGITIKKLRTCATEFSILNEFILLFYTSQVSAVAAFIVFGSEV
ncbi:MAG TPA: hypothetical protein PL045_10165, partial [Chitinophagaceae bacterium]|nr:hypothetical protein [Chitinophagaceae bacterium]